MARPDVVITEFMDESAVEALRAQYDVLYDATLVDRQADLLATLVGARALIVRNRTQVNTALLEAAPGLVVVGRLGVGLDNIDLPACRARHIEVIPATGANALAVAEYVIATAMVLLRGAYLSSAEVAAGNWPRPRLSGGREIGGKTLGLVGFGGIGRLTARLAQALGMHVLAHDPLVAPDDALWARHDVAPRDIDALLAEADVVSLHVPLTDATRGLMDPARIARMKPGAVLINTARGGIVNEPALADALREGRLAGAALDVFDREPLPAGSPLAGTPNLILTPHIGGVTRESNTRVSTLIAQKVGAFLRECGQPS
ncbi:MAG: 3-phosphoglycerate dehydrogenase [Lautropia sp.]|nr:MAG: 3-phosphoglycerate dehydrogenase [Pseudomonadota bacterium]MBC6958108.1 3-phosphoglycerate dehydrogenase [Lautropia sp.]MCL4700613.1 hydroxyacid dehydrogenase [Burkholderiaceae bacterium]MCZ2414702.1 hydroxyacid dehydrogenase [Burkholderiales bacterium]MDL1906031.1 hydroxyacid dehydrogenase [Betaproteobacteria bacterium PRO1]